MIYTNFNIFKNTFKKEGSNQPDYKISAIVSKEGEPIKSIDIGGGWIKEGKNGKYISCRLSENPAPLTDTEKENIRLLKEREEKKGEIDISNIPF